MPTTKVSKLNEYDGNDPLGFGLRSIAEPLQRWWLIGVGNPNFDTEVRVGRLFLGIPELGFSNTAAFVDWLAKRTHQCQLRELPISFTFDGQLLEDRESLIKFHHRNISWPIKESDFPGPCCSTDPLFTLAKGLAFRFGIALAGSEPGFYGATEAVVGKLLVDCWPDSKSLRGSTWTEIITDINHITGEQSESRIKHRRLGLKSSRGEGKKLPVWFKWWKLRQEDKEIGEIARLTDSDVPGSRTYDLKTISSGIAAVEKMMMPVEKLNDA